MLSFNAARDDVGMFGWRSSPSVPVLAVVWRDGFRRFRCSLVRHIKSIWLAQIVPKVVRAQHNRGMDIAAAMQRIVAIWPWNACE